jgi:cytochrome c-type biogenesis protein CcmE
VATALVLVAFNDNLVFFYSPSELKAKAVAADHEGNPNPNNSAAFTSPANYQAESMMD